MMKISLSQLEETLKITNLEFHLEFLVIFRLQLYLKCNQCIRQVINKRG